MSEKNLAGGSAPVDPPAIGSRWKMRCDWKGRPYPQHGDWIYTVLKVEGEWVTVRIKSYGEAGVDEAKIKVQAWNPEGYVAPKGHHVWFEKA